MSIPELSPNDYVFASERQRAAEYLEASANDLAGAFQTGTTDRDAIRRFALSVAAVAEVTDGDPLSLRDEAELANQILNQAQQDHTDARPVTISGRQLRAAARIARARVVKRSGENLGTKDVLDDLELLDGLASGDLKLI